jgi:hypothetical protein
MDVITNDHIHGICEKGIKQEKKRNKERKKKKGRKHVILGRLDLFWSHYCFIHIVTLYCYMLLMALLLPPHSLPYMSTSITM